MAFVFYSVSHRQKPCKTRDVHTINALGDKLNTLPLCLESCDTVKSAKWPEINGTEARVYIHFKAANRSGRYFCANTNHMWDLRGPSQTSVAFQEKDVKSYVRSTFFFLLLLLHRLQIIQPRFSRSHLGCALRTQVIVRTDSHRNPRSKPPLKLKTLRVELARLFHSQKHVDWLLMNMARQNSCD